MNVLHPEFNFLDFLVPLNLVAGVLGFLIAWLTVAVLERLASSFPADGALEELIGVVYRDGLNRPDEAARHLERARELGPR